MGIKGLAKLLSDEAPDSIREVELKSLQGRKIAVDASMAIYQFLIAVRTAGAGPNQQQMQLTNAEGETTSHIQGMFNRTIRYLSEGIRVAYVFDGKPPDIKSGELTKRREKRKQAEERLKAAEEEGNVEEQDKQNRRLVRAGTKENDDCRKLLTLMGVPVVQAPMEAEAQAAAMARAGSVYAASTEDMDALTFQAPILLRKMTFANASKSMIQTIDYKKAVEGLNLTHEQFVDLCILLGCDYCDNIKGVGPKTALKLIREHKNIEGILETIDRKKYTVPPSWIPGDAHKDDEEASSADEEEKPERPSSTEAPAFVQARGLFLNHETEPNVELKWKPCQAEELTKFLVDDMGFNPDRVASSIDKLKAAFEANKKPQTRMDSFFAVKANPNKAAAKRKPAPAPTKPLAKKGRGRK